MKALTSLEEIIGKTIIFQEKVYGEDKNYILLITSEKELFAFKPKNSGFEDLDIKMLDFYEIKDLILEYDKTASRVRKLCPEIFENFEDEVAEIRKEKKRKADYELYQKLKKQFEEEED